MEEWKDVIGYEGLYQVSNLGNVRSLNYNHTNKPKNLKQTVDSNGYLVVSLCKNNIKKKMNTHRLVAQAFIHNDNNLPEVNHKDEDKANNKVENLEWCSSKYNCNYGSRAKKISSKLGRKIKCITTNTIYSSAAEAERLTGVPNPNIIKCCKGNLKSAGKLSNGEKLIWKYYEED